MKIPRNEMVTAALCLALALLLPFLTMQLPQIGQMLLPMHIPVLLCGFLCGPRYGTLIGGMAPLLRSVLFTAPPLPMAILMAFELATYGFITGFFSKRMLRSPNNLWAILLAAMIGGRLIWGLTAYLFFSFGDTAFTWHHFLNATVFVSIPGIFLQILVVPPLILLLDRAMKGGI